MNQMMMNSVQGLVGNFMQGFQRGLELNRLRRAGLRLNDAGIAYGRKGNWTAAVNSFRRALQYANDPVIRRNLARAEEERSGRAAARRRAKRVKLKKIKDLIGNLAKSLAQDTSPAATAGSRSDANELAFLTPGGTAFFGLGGEAPAPVDARREPRGPPAGDDNGLAFIPPGGQPSPLGSSDPSVVDLRPPTAPGGVEGVQVATADGTEGLQFLSPYASPKAAPAGGPGSSAAPAKPPAGGYSRKADILLDALRDGRRDWQRSRNILQRRLALNPDDADVRAALADLDAARKLARGKAAPQAPPAPTPGGREIAQLTAEGRKYIEEGNFAAARDKFLAAWARDPGNEEVTNLAVATKAVVDRDTGVLIADARQAEAGGDYLTAREKLFQARRLSPADETIAAKIKALDHADPNSIQKRMAIDAQNPSDTTPPAKVRAGAKTPVKAPAEPVRQASIDRIDVPSPAITKCEPICWWQVKEKVGEQYVRAQAWYNDDLHREWLGDAFTIATLPLGAGSGAAGKAGPKIWHFTGPVLGRGAKVASTVGKAGPNLGQLTAAEVGALRRISKRYGVEFRIMGSKAEVELGIARRSDPLLQKYLYDFRAKKWWTTGTDVDVWMDLKKVRLDKRRKLVRELEKLFRVRQKGSNVEKIDWLGYSARYQKDVNRLPSIRFSPDGRVSQELGWGKWNWKAELGGETGYYTPAN